MSRPDSAGLRGWPGPGGGRAAHIAAGVEYQGTTVQLCGLNPFVAGSGSPTEGTRVGRNMLTGEPVCLDPLDWANAGLVTNPGVFVLGQPGAGKSALVKRLITGATAYGRTVLVLGDTKPEYVPLVARLGGQVLRIGRGLDRINPLDAGPLTAALHRSTGSAAQQLRLEIRGRRLGLLLALCTLIRGRRVSNAEEVVLGRAIDLLTDRLHADPTIPDVLTVLTQRPDQLRSAARIAADGQPRPQTDLVPTLTLLAEGTLAGVFDQPTTTPLNVDAPAVSIDISRVTTSDQLGTAAMLCTWAYGHAVVDTAAALTDARLAPRRQFLAVMDELWRALRGAPGLVDHADALTRLNRARGMASIMITHSLDDLDALPTPHDRAKARGFAERAAIKILAALPGRELDRISTITHLTTPERDLVASWAAPETRAGRAHPGRGKYLIKTGERPGLPVAMTLIGDEPRLYDTDAAIRPTRPVPVSPGQTPVGPRSAHAAPAGPQRAAARPQGGAAGPRSAAARHSESPR